MGGIASYQRGKAAEDYAACYLQRQGYSILERNFRGGGGELDLIALKSETIYFVEVRARKAGLATAAESIRPCKRQRLQRAALAWLARHYQMETMQAVFLVLLLSPDGTGRITAVESLETAVL